jgi:hypothetical protein
MKIKPRKNDGGGLYKIVGEKWIKGKDDMKEL